MTIMVVNRSPSGISTLHVLHEVYRMRVRGPAPARPGRDVGATQASATRSK